MWYKSFILYYEKSKGKEDESNKSFSIELNLKSKDKNNHNYIIGKKQNFMIYQFKNGQIYEKEITLGNNPSDDYLLT